MSTEMLYRLFRKLLWENVVQNLTWTKHLVWAEMSRRFLIWSAHFVVSSVGFASNRLRRFFVIHHLPRHQITSIHEFTVCVADLRFALVVVWKLLWEPVNDSSNWTILLVACRLKVFDAGKSCSLLKWNLVAAILVEILVLLWLSICKAGGAMHHWVLIV